MKIDKGAIAHYIAMLTMVLSIVYICENAAPWPIKVVEIIVLFLLMVITDRIFPDLWRPRITSGRRSR